MFESEYIKNITIPPIDEKVTKAIENYPIEGGGKTMLIGVSNIDNEVYRIIHATGMGAYIHITSELADIGLKDKLENSMYGEKGLDSLFLIPKRMKSSLRKFEIIETPTVLDDISNQENSFKELTETERESLIKGRIGQGIFRQQLVDYWKGCAVTDCDFRPLLKASHIKPWRDSNNSERLDHFNGLLLSPNLDTAFDLGYISFDHKGKIIQSEVLDPIASYSLRITPKLKIKPKLFSESHIPYLEYHLENVFKNG